jgi:caa(3)-type oxidase subunit IV
MAGHDRKTYFKIFFALSILTVVEVAIPFVANKYAYAPGEHSEIARTSADSHVMLFNVFSPHWSSVALYALSIAKAGLVGLFFMHLKFETKWLKFIAILPAIAGLYAIMLGAEAFYRYGFEQTGVPTAPVPVVAPH